uniref:Uncharacterized protein n=1 Tax=Schizaphis graminum TaxID=13262 RepID=A0A2S2PLG3_SCHGA
MLIRPSHDLGFVRIHNMPRSRLLPVLSEKFTWFWNFSPRNFGGASAENRLITATAVFVDNKIKNIMQYHVIKRKNFPFSFPFFPPQLVRQRGQDVVANTKWSITRQPFTFY